MSYSITSSTRASSAGGTLSLARGKIWAENRPVWWCGVELAFKWGAMH